MDAYFCCQRLQPIDLDLFSVMEVHGPLQTITNCKKKNFWKLKVCNDLFGSKTWHDVKRGYL